MKINSFFAIVATTLLLASGVAKADPIPGDLYGIAPGLGNSGGFFLATGSAVTDAVFDGVVDTIATDLGGGTIDVTEVLTDNGDGTKTVYIEMVSTSGELFPSGFTDGGGIALDTAGFFMGASFGASPLDFDSPPVLVAGGPWGVAAVLGGFDASPGADLSGPGAATIGPFDVTSIFANPWDGSTGVSFGAGTVGLGTSTMALWVTYQVIPEPSMFGILALGAIGMVVRRRR